MGAVHAGGPGAGLPPPACAPARLRLAGGLLCPAGASPVPASRRLAAGMRARPPSGRAKRIEWDGDDSVPAHQVDAETREYTKERAIR